MAGWDLAQYIQHLADNRQQTKRYEIAFWSKLFYPWAALVMMVLAQRLRFCVRSGGVSFKIFAGVMIGVAFYGEQAVCAPGIAQHLAANHRRRTAESGGLGNGNERAVLD